MSIISNPESIELDDIQGILVRGYAQLPLCHFYFVQIHDPAIGRSLLHDLIPLITPATVYDSDISLNIAFSYWGLTALGLSEENVNNFPIPFKVGMHNPVRQKMLGDWGESASENWIWGGKNQDQIHALITLYASTEEQIAQFKKDIEDKIEAAQKKNHEDPDPKKAIEIIYEIGGYRKDDGKENFGFHDSISQPVIKGSGRSGPDNDIIASGEFVLGYLNEHDQYPS